jgi:hypothetical protein
MSVYDGYRSVLATDLLNEPPQWTFKSNPVYQQILEHVSPQQGREYLRLAQCHPRWTPRFMQTACEVALENDRYGKPERFDFDELGITCSPTNWRYLWHALSILDHDPQNIVEIGGGYGGLMLWLQRISRKPLDYMIYDLSEAKAVQQIYARLHDLTLSRDVPHPRFLVSAYGFSEFDEPTRRWYEENVIPTCEHGWLVWNINGLYPFTDKPLTVEDEQPQTGANNCVVTF